MFNPVWIQKTRWFETRGVAALLTMRVRRSISRSF
jgi:hypothetical protein